MASPGVPRVPPGLRVSANVELRLRVDGKTPPTDAPLRAALGDVLDLTVVTREVGGEWLDVTRHPATRFATATPWLVEVDQRGHSVVRRDPRFRGPLATAVTGSVTVIYEDPESRRLGFADVLFDVSEEGAAGEPVP